MPKLYLPLWPLIKFSFMKAYLIISLAEALFPFLSSHHICPDLIFNATYHLYNIVILVTDLGCNEHIGFKVLMRLTLCHLIDKFWYQGTPIFL